MWFTQPGTDSIGRITMAGEVTEYPSSAGSSPQGIAAGPDGAIWFTEYGSSRIGRMLVFPVAETGAASGITPGEATVAGSIDPNGAPATYRFEYGPTTGYGMESATASTGPGLNAQPVSATLSGLAPATTYHYRLSASNPRGATSGSDGTFTTAAKPGGPTGPATRFRIVRVKLSKKTGGATVTIDVPGAGRAAILARARVPRPPVAARTKAITAARGSKRATQGGRLRVKVKPSRLGRVALRLRGRLRTTMRVSFTPAGGTRTSLRRGVTLRLTRPRR
jgi:hypothetical protein